MRVVREPLGDYLSVEGHLWEWSLLPNLVFEGMMGGAMGGTMATQAVQAAPAAPFPQLVNREVTVLVVLYPDSSDLAIEILFLGWTNSAMYSE